MMNDECVGDVKPANFCSDVQWNVLLQSVCFFCSLSSCWYRLSSILANN